MRRAARTDENHQEIIDAFRKLGYSVYSTHRVGSGFPDLVCGKFGHNHLVEVKDSKKSPSQRKLTELEEKFFKDWLGSVHIIESVQDVIEFNRKRIRHA